MKHYSWKAYTIIFALILLFLYFGLKGREIESRSKNSQQIVLTVLYDYQCMYCHALYSTLQKLMNENIEIVWMPVALLNQTSLLEATSALAAFRDDSANFNILNSIFLNSPRLTSSQVQKILVRLGFDSPGFVAHMHSASVEQQLLNGLALLKRYHSQSVPLIIISRLNPTEKSQSLKLPQSILFKQHPVTILSGEQTYQTLRKVLQHV